MTAPETGMIVTGMIQTASFVVLCAEAEVVAVGRRGLEQLTAVVVLSWGHSSVSQMLQQAALAGNARRD